MRRRRCGSSTRNSASTFTAETPPPSPNAWTTAAWTSPSCWGFLLPQDSPLAANPAVTPEDLDRVPLIIHRRVGLQREIAHWARRELEQLNVAATYNVVNGDPSPFVRSGLGCFLTSSDHLPKQLDAGLCFRPLDPPLKIRHALVWKRYAVLSKAAQALLEKLRGDVPEK